MHFPAKSMRSRTWRTSVTTLYVYTSKLTAKMCKIQYLHYAQWNRCVILRRYLSKSHNTQDCVLHRCLSVIWSHDEWRYDGWHAMGWVTHCRCL